MTYQEARDTAVEFGAKLPAFDHTSPVAQCWIDRIEYLLTDRHMTRWERESAIKEANRYA